MDETVSPIAANSLSAWAEVMHGRASVDVLSNRIEDKEVANADAELATPTAAEYAVHATEITS
eukprot:3907597-Rhodomonas_salina.1